MNKPPKRDRVIILRIDTQTSEIKVGNIIFLISSHFKEKEAETVDQTLARLICESTENMITEPK